MARRWLCAAGTLAPHCVPWHRPPGQVWRTGRTPPTGMIKRPGCWETGLSLFPMKKLRWQILVVIVTLVVVGVLLLTQQPGPVSAPLPTTGGIYTEALIGAFSRLTPLTDQNNPPDRDIDRLIFSGLVKFDARGLPVPDL